MPNDDARLDVYVNVKTPRHFTVTQRLASM